MGEMNNGGDVAAGKETGVATSRRRRRQREKVDVAGVGTGNATTGTLATTDNAAANGLKPEAVASVNSVEPESPNNDGAKKDGARPVGATLVGGNGGDGSDGGNGNGNGKEPGRWVVPTAVEGMEYDDDGRPVGMPEGVTYDWENDRWVDKEGNEVEWPEGVTWEDSDAVDKDDLPPGDLLGSDDDSGSDLDSDSDSDDGDYYSGDDAVEYLLQQALANRELTAEEAKRLRKRERTQKIISGIGDAVRALANLVYTDKYAPNMYGPTTGMSEKTRERWDKIMKARRDEADKRLNYILKGYDIRRKGAESEWKREMEKKKQAREDARQAFAEKKEEERKREWKMKTEVDIAFKEWEMALKEGNLELAKEKLEVAKDRQRAYEDYLNSKRAANSGGSKSGGGKSGGGKDGYWAQGADGQWRFFKSAKAATDYAIVNGTADSVEVTTTSTNEYGETRETRKKVYSPKQPDSGKATNGGGGAPETGGKKKISGF